MKYKLELEIDLPRDRVVELFDNPENLKKWQTELVNIELLSGEAGQVGAKSKLIYQMGQKEVVLVETITSKNLPEEFSGTYETQGVWNRIENRFENITQNKTNWLFESEFRFEGFMKIVGFLTPWLFKKQSFKLMKQFKGFAEKA